MTTQTQTIFHPSAEKRRILIVEDEAVNQMILSRFLEDVYEVIPAMNGTEAMELIHAQYEAISLILLDLNLPDIHGLDILRRLNANPHYARIPVIVMTADSKAELDCLTLGAIDFIPKPYPQQEIVLARIRRIVELSEDRDLLHWTERDHLTGLYNKDFFFRYASMLDDYHKTLETDVMVVDVNRFHTINNRFGKACGDKVLRQIAEQALELVHASGGIVCRSEADTFYLYCPHRSDYGEILEKLSVRLEGEGGENRVRLRMGVYSAADKSLDIERRFDRAKMAADAVKGSVANAVGLYDHSMYEEELFTEQLIEAFPEALREKQFTVYFQPKFDIRADEPVLCSAEALARWKHPQMGMVSPAAFIPLFENNGLIQALDHFIWSEAAAEVRRLKERLGVCIPISINVSRIDLLDPMLTEKLRGIVEDNGLDYGSLILEITESAYTEDSGQIVEAVKRLREMGFVIEMDDFGTGYSSLNMLSSLPIDVLKLDMKFIRSALRDQKASRLLEAIIHLAESIDVPCIAEGVEEAGQVAELKRMGCDIIQGYFFSRPLPAEEYERFVREHTVPAARQDTEETLAQ